MSARELNTIRTGITLRVAERLYRMVLDIWHRYALKVILGVICGKLVNILEYIGLVTTKRALDSVNDAYLRGIQQGVKSGQEIGMLKVLEYNRDNSSEPKFKEFAEKFDYETLKAKYPQVKYEGQD